MKKKKCMPILSTTFITFFPVPGLSFNYITHKLCRLEQIMYFLRTLNIKIQTNFRVLYNTLILNMGKLSSYRK